ncbi:hypothetical protein J0H58_22460 [bacterium]|nr:hypothetical protein [bacterium]
MITEISRGHVLLDYGGRTVWVGGDMFPPGPATYMLFKDKIRYVRIVEGRESFEDEVIDEQTGEQIIREAESELTKRGRKVAIGVCEPPS